MKSSIDTQRTEHPEAGAYSVAKIKTIRFIGWLGIVSCGIEAIVIIILQGLAFGTNSFNSRFDLQVYSGCFIWCFLFLFYIMVDTVFQENVIQMYAFNLFHLGYVGFGIYQVIHLPNAIFIANIIVLLTFLLIYLLITKWIHADFGWQLYKRLGANPKIPALFRNFQIFLVLIKGDFLFTMLFLVLQIFVLLGFQNYETYIDIVTPPLFIIVWFLAIHAIKKERRPLMICIIILSILGVVYFLYKLIIYHVGPQYIVGGKYQDISTSILTINAAFCLFLYLLTSANTIILYINFGKGLARYLIGNGVALEAETEMRAANEKAPQVLEES